MIFGKTDCVPTKDENIFPLPFIMIKDLQYFVLLACNTVAKVYCFKGETGEKLKRFITP